MENKIHFPNINGLRFISALMVFVFHVFTLHREIWGDFFSSFWFQKAGIVLSRGHHGVLFFFIISSFLITYLVLQEISITGGFKLWNFLIRRFLRIWPLYFLIVIFGFFIFPSLPFGVQTVHELWRFVLFLSNFDEIANGANDSINFLTTTWSVSAEEQYYITSGLIVWVSSQLFYRFGAYLFLFIALSALYFRWVFLGDSRMLYFHPLSVMGDFAIGGILGFWSFKGNLKTKIQSLSRSRILIIYAVGCAIILFEDHLFRGSFLVFQRLIPGLFLGFVLVEQVFARHSFWKSDRISWLRKGGDLTYGFYLFHTIILFYISHLFVVLGWTDSIYDYLLYVSISLAITIAIAHLSYRYFESPILRLKNKFR